MSFTTGGHAVFISSPNTESSTFPIAESFGSIVIFTDVPIGVLVPEVLDPYLPIHITQVVPGIEIRISLQGGYHMVPRRTKNGDILVPDDKKSSRRGYEKSVLIGRVTANNPELGQLSMVAYDEAQRKVYRATVPYTFMAVAQRVVPNFPEIETASSPGSVAIGSKLIGGQLLNPRVRLVRIKF